MSEDKTDWGEPKGFRCLVSADNKVIIGSDDGLESRVIKDGAITDCGVENFDSFQESVVLDAKGTIIRRGECEGRQFKSFTYANGGRAYTVEYLDFVVMLYRHPNRDTIFCMSDTEYRMKGIGRVWIHQGDDQPLEMHIKDLNVHPTDLRPQFTLMQTIMRHGTKNKK